MKRLAFFFLMICLFFTIGHKATYAGDNRPLPQKKVMVYLKPDVTVELNSIKQSFRDSKGALVYPIIYNGSTYLPVRSASVLMKEPIEWDEASKTVFIGRTLSNPNKASVDVNTNAVQELYTLNNSNTRLKAEMVNAYLKPDVLVMYDFVLQTFEDANGNVVYPIIYNGSTYLPIRAISELMKEPVEWDGVTKTIFIGDGEDTSQTSNAEEVEKISLAAKKLKSLFEREEVLYYEATAKTTSLKVAVSLEDKQLIATAISENYLNAQKLTTEIKELDVSDCTKEERAAYEKIVAFIESTEYYILVLENIAYLSAQDTDYSMLAETFLYFALESQTKMEEARNLVLEISQ